MQLLFFVLNRSEMLDDILTSFADHDIHGATILDSKGMVHLLASHSDEGEVPFFGAMRAFLKPERENSNLIIAAVNDDHHRKQQRPQQHPVYIISFENSEHII